MLTNLTDQNFQNEIKKNSDLYIVEIGAQWCGACFITEIDLKESSGTDQLTSSQTGLAFGGMFGHTINNTFSLELEVMYLQMGGTQMANSENPNIEISMSVLEIPLFVKASFGNTVRPYFKAGPTVGFILSSEAKTEYGCHLNRDL